jgi:hypothetical protein
MALPEKYWRKKFVGKKCSTGLSYRMTRRQYVSGRERSTGT